MSIARKAARAKMARALVMIERSLLQVVAEDQAGNPSGVFHTAFRKCPGERHVEAHDKCQDAEYGANNGLEIFPPLRAACHYFLPKMCLTASIVSLM